MDTIKKKKIIDVRAVTYNDLDKIIDGNQQFINDIIKRLNKTDAIIEKLYHILAFIMKLCMQTFQYNEELEKRISELEKRYDDDHSYQDDNDANENDIDVSTDTRKLIAVLVGKKKDDWIN